MFYDNFVHLCVRDGISPTAAAKKAGFGPSHVFKWKNGSKPSDVTVLKLMEGNNWTAAELLGETEKAAVLNSDLSEAQKALIEKAYTLTDEQCLAWLRLLG